MVRETSLLRIVYIAQGLLEFGIFSIFLPRNKIPDWFSNYRNVGFSIKKDSRDADVCSVSFAMPSLPSIRFEGLNLGVVCSCGNQGGIYHLVTIRTKDIGWVYSPIFSVAANDGDVIFLSQWNMEDLFEVGDELLSGLPLKMIEIQLVYDQEHVQDNQCLQNLIENGNLSRYEFSPDWHFLCHYHYKAFQCLGKIFWSVFSQMVLDLFLDLELKMSALHQYLTNLWDHQDSQHIPFGQPTMLGRAHIHRTYILRLVCPLLVAADYHFQQFPSPISCVVVEMTTMFKWLIRYPDFVPDSNFVEGCLTSGLAELAVMQERFEPKHIQKIHKEVINKLSRRALQIGQNLVTVSKQENINQGLDGVCKVDVLVVFGTDGIGKTTIAKFVYLLKFDLLKASSSVENINETSEELNGLVHSLRQLLYDVLK